MARNSRSKGMVPHYRERAYGLSKYVWMGLHLETAGEAFWNKDHTKGPVHEMTHNNIGLMK